MLRKVISIAFAAGLIPAHVFAADPPTRILFNGSVLTMDPSDRVASAGSTADLPASKFRLRHKRMGGRQ